LRQTDSPLVLHGISLLWGWLYFCLVLSCVLGLERIYSKACGFVFSYIEEEKEKVKRGGKVL
jgi:hypothetical protein